LESYREAVAIGERLVRDNPSVTDFQRDLATCHNNIGSLQNHTGHPDLASESYRKALAILEPLAREHPTSPEYASVLGATLNNLASIDQRARRFEQARDRLQQAISWQEKALGPNPKHPIYRLFLGNHLKNLIRAANALGNDNEAKAAQHKLDDLVATDPAKVAIDARVAAVTRGEPPRDNGERVQLAYRAYEKKLFGASAQLYAVALEADPKLCTDRESQHRYHAACSAVLAARAEDSPTLRSIIDAKANGDARAANTVGRAGSKSSTPVARKHVGTEAQNLFTDVDRAKLPNQARAWLEAELATWAKVVASASTIQRQAIASTVQDWQEDLDLASVRDENALAKLPDDERRAWKSLWANVDALLTKARK
jgi:tetratricopeptide (TPR) repeat protein